MSDMGHDQNTHGAPDGDVEADTASGGAPEAPDDILADTASGTESGAGGGGRSEVPEEQRNTTGDLDADDDSGRSEVPLEDPSVS